MSKMPAQRPGQSEQSVGTPPEFIKSVQRLLDDSFEWDLAADANNTVVKDDWYDGSKRFYSEQDDSLKQDWHKIAGWGWCNPPFEKLEPWVQKAYEESRKGAKVAMLVPASVGTLWWNHYVDKKAHVLFVRPRITFVGHNTPYPKDLALLLYTKYVRGGYRCWDWNESLKSENDS